ncbi:MAG: non-canonical purine NTP pyrophosphatase [Legionellales bacterium]|nr:non-canonical purine NTP pyrophosphatase [Legionellales bacterium]
MVILKYKKIVLATNNLNKVREINELFQESIYKIIPQSEFKVTEVEETGKTFTENALIKARNAAKYTDLPVIADDSGIEVDALDGRPGIFSARYSGIGATDKDNLTKLIKDIKHIDRKNCQAKFICAMVYIAYENDPNPIIVEGIWKGYVITKPRGVNGFGYDPIFYVPEYECTSAELDRKKKNQLSHRGQAIRKLTKKLNEIK